MNLLAKKLPALFQNEDLMRSLKEFATMVYFIFIFVFLIVLVIEAKLYFNFDIPGVDLPIDELYIGFFK